MAVSNKLIIGLASMAVVTGLAVGGSSIVSAQNGYNGDSLIDKIATKFNLNKDEVEAVFEENRNEQQTERLADASEDLQAAVDDGNITAEQKTLIENKIKEDQAARDAERTALEDWATANNIDARYVMMGGGRGGMRGGDSDRLQNAVDDGDITAEQKTMIEAKQAELEAAREAQQDALDAWATENNIDTDYLRTGMGGPGGNGDGSRGRM